MKIYNLKAENIKALKAVEIDTKGRNVIEITGANAQGKTSVLDAMYWALAGSKNIQEQPIRKGQKKASVSLDLGDYIVERRITEKTTQLIVSNKDGARFPSPQKLLDKFYGDFTFDPLEFMRLSKQQKYEKLQGLCGDFDWDKWQEGYDKLYNKRRELNSIFKFKAREIENFDVSEFEGAPEKEIDINLIDKELDSAREIREQKNSAINYVKIIENNVYNQDRRIKELRVKIEELKQELEETIKENNESYAALENAREKANSIIVPDIEELTQNRGKALESNEKIKSRMAHEKLVSEIENIESSIQDINLQMTMGIDKKAEIISKSLKQLGNIQLQEDGAIIVDGIPIDQLSSSEQLKLSVRFAMQANPELRIIRINDGSLLDSASMKIINGLCDEQDFQAWIEVVDESGKVGIVIEDGEVVRDNYE